MVIYGYLSLPKSNILSLLLIVPLITLLQSFMLMISQLVTTFEPWSLMFMLSNSCNIQYT